MLHATAHYAFIVALACSGLSTAVLVFLLGIAVAYRKTYLNTVVWEVPTVVGVLSAFWGLVALGCHTL